MIMKMKLKMFFYEPKLVKFIKQYQGYEVEQILKTRTRNKKKEKKIKAILRI